MAVGIEEENSSVVPPTKLFDKKFINVLLLGLAFMLVFTAFQTCGMIEQTVLDSFAEDHEYAGSGYTSLAIVYIVFACANWIAPLVVSWMSAKWAMLLGGIVYTLFVALFIYPYTWSLYLGSVLIGFAAAFIWTGQGNFLTVNSDSETMARNSGIFWALLQCSLLFGNLFVFIEFNGATHIGDQIRETVFGVLTVVSVLGCLVMLFFRTDEPAFTFRKNVGDPHADEGPLESIVKALQLIKTKKMILLCFTFFYTGLELSFFSGVYGTCIGRTMAFGDSAKQLVGINGMVIGVGEIIGGAAFGLLGKKTIRYGRDPIIVLGYVVHIVTFFLIFINIPTLTAFYATTEPAYIESSMYLAIVCSFLLGFADSCFNTQCYSIVGATWPNDSVPAFSIFKFMQSLSCAIAFFYTPVIDVQWQLLILVIFGTMGTITFCMVELDAHQKQRRAFEKDIATIQD